MLKGEESSVVNLAVHVHHTLIEDIKNLLRKRKLRRWRCKQVSKKRAGE